VEPKECIENANKITTNGLLFNVALDLWVNANFGKVV